jgi:glycopeptide antibiotics resistance protein
VLHSTFFKPVVILLAVAIPAWFIGRRAFRKKTTGIDISFSREFLLFVFYLYLIAIAAITIVPLSYSVHRTPGENDLNFIPFKTTMNAIRHAMKYERFRIGMLFQNTAGNIVMFIPLGFLLPLVIKKINSFPRIFFAGLLFSVFIESIQYAERSFGVYRSVDIDDVILNTIGAVAGWIILCVMRWFSGLFQPK